MPGPGTSIHGRSSPTTSRSESLGWRRRVTTQQKSRAGPSIRAVGTPGREPTSHRHSAPVGPASTTSIAPGGHLPLPYQVGERSGPHAQVGDVAQPIGRVTLDTKGVDDVLTVGPGLHESGRGERGQSHGRPVPGDAGGRVGGRQRLHHAGVGPLPPRPELGTVDRASPDQVSLHRIAGRHRLLGRPGEPVGVDQGLVTGLVEEGQMADLVTDGPPLGRRGQVPLGSVRRPGCDQRWSSSYSASRSASRPGRSGMS